MRAQLSQSEKALREARSDSEKMQKEMQDLQSKLRSKEHTDEALRSSVASVKVRS